MLKRVLPALGLLLLALGAWWWVASWDSVDDLLLASPTETWQALRDDRELLLDNAWVTLVEVLLGLAIAIAAAFLLAVAMHLVRPLRDAAYPCSSPLRRCRSSCWRRSSCSLSTTASGPSWRSWR